MMYSKTQYDTAKVTSLQTTPSRNPCHHSDIPKSWRGTSISKRFSCAWVDEVVILKKTVQLLATPFPGAWNAALYVYQERHYTCCVLLVRGMFYVFRNPAPSTFLRCSYIAFYMQVCVCVCVYKSDSWTPFVVDSPLSNFQYMPDGCAVLLFLRLCCYGGI